MRCRECGTRLARLDNDHLLSCCGLTLQEYALRHHTPMDLLVQEDQINVQDDPQHYGPRARHVSEAARAILAGLRLAGLVYEEDGFSIVPGEVRRLDQLLWDLQYLAEYGFAFRQEFYYDQDSHRVAARNRLKAPCANLRPSATERLAAAPAPDFATSSAVCIAHAGYLNGGFLFLELPNRRDGRYFADELMRRFSVRMTELDAAVGSQGALLRAASIEDSKRLLETLRPQLTQIPYAWEAFFEPSATASVVKEVVFDSAHFITDHPAKCKNLHGGRYVLHVEVRDRIDPISGCVVDFGYLKRVANRRVVDCFDHHTLNYATTELAWRSSAELLCVYIWEQLIEYLPGLAQLTLYETPQSWCCYRGPNLAEFQRCGRSALLSHFSGADLGSSPLRAALAVANTPRVRALSNERA